MPPPDVSGQVFDMCGGDNACRMHQEAQSAESLHRPTDGSSRLVLNCEVGRKDHGGRPSEGRRLLQREDPSGMPV